MSPTLLDRIRAIEWLVLDVDGVLTDGGIYYDNDGVESKRFHVRDGSGLKIWGLVGHRAAIITGRTSKLVALRAAELGIDPVIQGAGDKLSAFRRFLAETGASAAQVCAVGDDVSDLGVLRHAGLSVAVADACAEARTLADHVTRAAGGHGAVREVVEVILGVQGKWRPVVERFRNESL